ncbi:hypothetical protein HJC23_001774 [Cyclotella cryptica]|uniref:Uncharacterized protein n=1 Tax=Cyclotella cryptica TaxID=29204 RepID=A0ABD3QW32_9STRA
MKGSFLVTASLLARAQRSLCFSAIAFGNPSCTSTGTGCNTSMRLFSRSSLPVTEDQYPRFLSSAALCANSDSCSIDTAESYLREIVRIESACAAGTMSGDSICKDVGKVSEVVAGLREKIRQGAKQEVKTFWQQRQDEFQNLVSSSIDSQSNNMTPVAALTQAPIKPAYLAIAALYAVLVVSLFQTANTDPGTLSRVVPFTTQEVWWAIRDGYVVDLMSAWLKNGGLVISDDFLGTSSLMPQEVWWSIRDGYSSNLFF